MERALLSAALLLFTSGCVARSDPSPVIADAAPAAPFDWHVGAWWSYAARFAGDNRTYGIALVIDKVEPDRYVVGSNLSAGFFGLPFDGNVSRPGLNPRIAGADWPLFDFPLADGKSWSYTLFGYPVTAKARAAPVERPGAPASAGYVIEAASYGHLFARYTYSAAAGWFTELTLFDPVNGTVAAEVKLTGEGSAWSRDYYVEVPLARYVETYPTTTTERRFDLQGNYAGIVGTLALEGDVGEFRARLANPDGRDVLAADVTGRGAIVDREQVDAKPGTWVFSQLPLGSGWVRLEVYGLAAKSGETSTAPEGISPAAMAAVSRSLLVGPSSFKAENAEQIVLTQSRPPGSA